MIPRIWQFFTMWQLSLLIAASSPPYSWISHYLNLPFLSSLVLMIGSHLSWIEPRAYYIPIYQSRSIWVIHRWPTRLLIDIFFHAIPFFYALKVFGPPRIEWNTTPGTMAILSLYAFIFPIHQVYHVSILSIVPPSFLTICIFLFYSI